MMTEKTALRSLTGHPIVLNITTPSLTAIHPDSHHFDESIEHGLSNGRLTGRNGKK
jgi:hypothetical protein